MSSDDKLRAALDWAARGFKVFPLRAGSKKPRTKSWPAEATSDPSRIRAMWQNGAGPAQYNVGVLTDDLIVVDLDQKRGKNGIGSYLEQGFPLDTLIVRTPSNGLHVYFSGPSRANSAGKVAPGIDIRSHHGYVIAPGSWLDPGDPDNNGVGGHYGLDNDAPVCAAPGELLGRLDLPRERSSVPSETPVADLDSASAVIRAIRYLEEEAPLAIEGDAGDATAYRVAATLKDYGLSEDVAFNLLLDRWNERCAPPWGLEDLQQKVANAYAYGRNPPGSESPENLFRGVNIPPVTPSEHADAWFNHGDPWENSVSWLFYSLLPVTGVCLLSGPSQGGKTFVLLELARALATGKAFFDIEPDERGGTLFLFAGTEGSGFARRLAALQEKEKLPIAGRKIGYLGVRGGLDQLFEGLKTKMAKMAEEHGVPVRLLVLETLSASGLLDDENDNAKAAQAMGNLATLGEALGVTVIVSHHPPKEGAGERGASAIRDNADYVLELQRDGRSKTRELELTKARDAEQKKIGAFTLLPVKLGTDGRGRDIESLVLSTGAPISRAERASTYAETLVQAIEHSTCDEGAVIEGETWCEIEDAKTRFRDAKSGSREPGPVSRAFSEALRYCEGHGSVESVVFAGRRYLRAKTF